MPATYEDPSESNKDAVRFRIGDTVGPDFYLTDGEINYCLAQKNDDVLLASMMAIENIIAKLAYDAGNESVGPVSEGGAQAAIEALTTTYANIARELSLTAIPVFTGQTVEEKLCPDYGYTQPAFVRPLKGPWGTHYEWSGRSLPGFGFYSNSFVTYPLLSEEDE